MALSVAIVAAMAFAAGAPLVSLPASGAPGGERAVGAQLERTPILFQTERNGNFDLYAMDERDRRQRAVVRGPTNDQDPAWAPTGPRLAFSSDRDGSWQIYVTEVGRTPRRITRGTASNVDPRWSPDGRLIAFETNRNGDWDVYVMTPDGRSQRRLSKGPSDDLDPAWAPDAASVAFARIAKGRSDIYRAVLATGAIEPVVTSATSEFEPAISPGGDRIAFSRLVGANYDIFVMDLRDKREVRLTSAPTVDEDPSWSPQGDRVIFTSEPRSARARRRGGASAISVVPAGGGVAATLTGNRPGNDSEPDWRPAPAGAAFSTPVAVAADHGVGGFPCGPVATTGTSGSFHLVGGGAGRDRLCGTGHRDLIRSYGGRDHLAGRQERDRLEGGSSGDWFYTKDGERDVLYGGAPSGDGSSRDWAHLDKSKDVRHGINKLEP